MEGVFSRPSHFSLQQPERHKHHSAWSAGTVGDLPSFTLRISTFLFFSIMVDCRMLTVFPVLYTAGPCCLSILYIILWSANPKLPAQPPPHPHHPHGNHTSVPYVCASVSLWRWVHLCHTLDSTRKWYHMVFVFLFLTSPHMIISRSIHVAENGIISFFLWLRSIPLYIWDISLSLSTHLSVDI